MSLFLAIPLLIYCIYMLSFSIATDSTWMLLYAPLVFVLGSRVCRATNWMDEENNDATD